MWIKLIKRLSRSMTLYMERARTLRLLLGTISMIDLFYRLRTNLLNFKMRKCNKFKKLFYRRKMRILVLINWILSSDMKWTEPLILTEGG